MRRLLDAHVAKARGDADELHLGTRDDIGERHRIVHTHIRITSASWLPLFYSPSPSHPNRQTKLCARLPHAWELIAERRCATPSLPRREHPRPCTQRAASPFRRAAANAPINVSPAAVVSTTRARKRRRAQRLAPSPSVTEPAPPSVMTATPTPLSSSAEARRRNSHHL